MRFFGSDNFDRFASETATMFENYVRAFIELNKPLLVFVNGPAVGIAVTTLALADYVLASDRVGFILKYLVVPFIFCSASYPHRSL